MLKVLECDSNFTHLTEIALAQLFYIGDMLKVYFLLLVTTADVLDQNQAFNFPHLSYYAFQIHVKHGATSFYVLK